MSSSSTSSIIVMSGRLELCSRESWETESERVFSPNEAPWIILWAPPHCTVAWVWVFLAQLAEQAPWDFLISNWRKRFLLPGSCSLSGCRCLFATFHWVCTTRCCCMFLFLVVTELVLFSSLEKMPLVGKSFLLPPLYPATPSCGSCCCCFCPIEISDLAVLRGLRWAPGGPVTDGWLHYRGVGLSLRTLPPLWASTRWVTAPRKDGLNCLRLCMLSMPTCVSACFPTASRVCMCVSGCAFIWALPSVSAAQAESCQVIPGS